MRARVQWTKTKAGFTASTQGGETRVNLIEKSRGKWVIKVNGETLSVASSEYSAKRFARNLL